MAVKGRLASKPRPKNTGSKKKLLPPLLCRGRPWKIVAYHSARAKKKIVWARRAHEALSPCRQHFEAGAICLKHVTCPENEITHAHVRHPSPCLLPSPPWLRHAVLASAPRWPGRRCSS